MALRTRLDKRTGLIIGAVAVVAAAGVTLGLVLSSGGDGGRTTFVSAWSASLGGNYVGAWTTDTALIVGTQTGGLTAYTLADGARKWSWAPPSGDQVCGMSPTSPDGYGAVLYGDVAAEDCGSLQLVDTDSGTAHWKQAASLTDTAAAGTEPSNNDTLEPSISGDVVTSPFGNGAFAVYSPTGSGGAPLWSANPGGAGASLYDGCDNLDGAAAIGSSVFALEDGCTTGGTDQLLRYGTATSPTPTKSYPLASTGGCGTPYLVAEGDYALVYCDNELTPGGSSSLWALPSAGGSLVQLDTSGVDLAIAMEGFGNNGASSGATSAQELNLAVFGNTLYLPIASTPGGANTNGEGIVAVSLDSGEQLWSKQSGQGSELVSATAANAVTVTQDSAGNDELENFAAATGATNFAPIPQPTPTTAAGTAATDTSATAYYLLDGNCLISIATQTAAGTSIAISRDPIT